MERPRSSESGDHRRQDHSSSREVSNSDDGFDSTSVSSNEEDLAPTHPITELQEAFEESIIEATEDVKYDTIPLSANYPTAELRRQYLLEKSSFDESWIARWRQKTSAKCHPLPKLVAQIIFGMHLLYNYQAKSDAEVVKILQAHVDDIDGFLEKTTDDFDLAIQDIEERLDFLRLPMTHLDVFDVMLDDKTFRVQLVDGNDKIEQIIKRTAQAMNASLFDVERGIRAMKELTRYLDKVKDDWPEDYTELPAIYAAMRGNEEGWLDCLQSLQLKGNKLGVTLVQLGATIGQMNRLAAAASRRSMIHEASTLTPRSKYASGGPNARQPRHLRHISKHSLDKPLPQEPDTLQPAVDATLPATHRRSQSSVLQRAEETSRRPRTSIGHFPTKHNSVRQEPHEPQNSQSAGTTTLATFLRHSKPPNASPDIDQRETYDATDRRPLPQLQVNDSAYSSGTEPAHNKYLRKQSRSPARFGLFPDSKPATPVSSRPTSAATNKMTLSIAPTSTPNLSGPSAPLGKSNHFSLRRMFHRKSRLQEAA